MAVHLQISEQVKKHRHAQQQFRELDAKREQAIEYALAEAKAGQAINVIEINRITNEMNQIATRFHFPVRKTVTIDMVKDVIQRSK
ncbi:DUF2533 family protein [Halalkalibacter oceani]|uniref:YpbS family protein n=1 Tax=Halalkalibacter oceani TaxID=1653776 RepID=A0A9X2DLJ1_9BACI|nr:DUF2533 family protein [Halalkalibacter oceani]MCM3712784.1 YpbS family protein [Halalkalibacter oceani]